MDSSSCGTTLPAPRCPLLDNWDALKKQIKEANDIVDVVSSYVTLRPMRSGTFKGLCPFHEDRNPSFDVDQRRQRYRCWACGKTGDVFSFIQEQTHVDFREALEFLARRAGISLEKVRGSRQIPGRAVMLEVVQWAAQQYHECLLESPLAEAARRYLGERKLTGETIRKFQLGYAPAAGDWLARRAAAARVSLDMLEKVGLLGRRTEGNGHYDRFRDRVMFPIRNVPGQTVGFGGRILPSSPFADRAKYYNSAESPLFAKSELLYGMDQARAAALRAGYVAVVEGYTDVLMAHQMGIAQVVSTMGTALNARHVKRLRQYVPNGRVVLVYDADAGGARGVDRALEIFVSQEVDLAIATLPDGMDPCDQLVHEGPEAFLSVLTSAVDALDFKMNQVLSAEASNGIEGRRRAMEAVLRIMALAPEMPGQEGAVKRELVVSRMAQRLALREETIWARLKELRAEQHLKTRPGVDGNPTPTTEEAKAPAHEQELLQVLLAEPKLVREAAAHIRVEEVEHPGLRHLLQGLYDLQAQGKTPDLDALRDRIDDPRLIEQALRSQEIALASPDRSAWLDRLVETFRERRVRPQKEELQNQLQTARDHTEAVELLRQLQQRTASPGPGSSSVEEPGMGRGGL